MDPKTSWVKKNLVQKNLVLKILVKKNIGSKNKFWVTETVGMFKKGSQEPTFKIGSVSAEIFLIWTNVARTNIAWTNVAIAVEIYSRWSQETIFQIRSKSGQYQLRYS